MNSTLSNKQSKQSIFGPIQCVEMWKLAFVVLCCLQRSFQLNLLRAQTYTHVSKCKIEIRCSPVLCMKCSFSHVKNMHTLHMFQRLKTFNLLYFVKQKEIRLRLNIYIILKKYFSYTSMFTFKMEFAKVHDAKSYRNRLKSKSLALDVSSSNGIKFCICHLIISLVKNACNYI